MQCWSVFSTEELVAMMIIHVYLAVVLVKQYRSRHAARFAWSSWRCNSRIPDKGTDFNTS